MEQNNMGVIDTKMNRGSEKYIESVLQSEVEARGGAAIKLSDPAKNGLPDRLILWPGGVAEFVELKSTGKKPRSLQCAVKSLITAMGFNYTVIDCISGIHKWSSSPHVPIRRK